MADPKLLSAVGRDAYEYPLPIGQLLINARYEKNEIVSAGRRFTYPDLVDRIHSLASVLGSLAVEPGDAVAVMDWDSHRYLECYFAIPMMGAVLQTVNVRLSRDVIAFTLRQARATVLLYHSDFADLVGQLREVLPDLRHIIALTYDQTA